MNPLARRHEILVQPVDDGVVVYDQGPGAAHALNPLAASVYRHADGSRDLGALAAAVSADLGAATDAETIADALEELARVDLVSHAEPPRGRQAIGRRDALRRIGIAAALPLVTSLVVPEPVLAQSRPVKPPKEPKPPKPPKKKP